MDLCGRSQKWKHDKASGNLGSQGVGYKTMPVYAHKFRVIYVSVEADWLTSQKHRRALEGQIRDPMVRNPRKLHVSWACQFGPAGH